MPRFAQFDPGAPAPQPVLAWFDTDAHDHVAVPPAEQLVGVPDDFWDDAESRGKLWAVSNGGLVPLPAPSGAAARYQVSQLTIVKRLTAAGLLRSAIAGLKLEHPMGDLTDAELDRRERWKAAATVWNTDQDARTFLSAIGADVNAILAPETEG